MPFTGRFRPTRSSPVRVFLSHTPEDTRFVDKLAEALTATAPRVNFQVFSNLELKPGDVPEEVRSAWLDKADVILLIVTSAFLHSPEAAIEVNAALERRRASNVRVIPVIFTEADWSTSPFASLTPIPPYIRSRNPENISNDPKTFTKIAEALANLVVDTDMRSTDTPFDKDDPQTLAFDVYWNSFSFYLFAASLIVLGMYAKFPAALQFIQSPSSSSPTRLLADAAVVGIIAMSLIQVTRRLFPVRGAFHRSTITHWLGEAGTAELYEKIGKGRASDLFDLPSEMLTAQLSAIAEQALEQSNGESTSALIERMALDAQSSYRSRQSKPSEKTEDQTQTRMENALAIQRNLDQLQIMMSATWRRYMLMTSILWSMALFVVGLRLFHAGGFLHTLYTPLRFLDWLTNFGALLLGTILAGIFGGFLGSIARDIVAIIEKLRR